MTVHTEVTPLAVLLMGCRNDDEVDILALLLLPSVSTRRSEWCLEGFTKRVDLANNPLSVAMLAILCGCTPCTKRPHDGQLGAVFSSSFQHIRISVPHILLFHKIKHVGSRRETTWEGHGLLTKADPLFKQTSALF